MPKSAPNSKLKTQVVKRANSLCEYCLANADYAFHPFPIDHIVPVSLGGKTVFENLANSCQFCNNSKYNKIECLDPLTGELVSLYNPRKDQWLFHFTWDEEKAIIIGLTPVGRATVRCLKVNRKEAVNLRKILASFGIHPPF